MSAPFEVHTCGACGVKFGAPAYFDQYCKLCQTHYCLRCVEGHEREDEADARDEYDAKMRSM